jgi:hypothetical protein
MFKERTRKSLLILWGVVYLWVGGIDAAAGATSNGVGQGSSSISTAQNLPRLELGEAVHNFGEASEGDVVSHDFVVRNVGSEELKIYKVRPD